MKLRIELLALMVIVNSLCVFGQKKTVNIDVSYTSSYCGGARPNDEMLAEMLKPKPYVDKKMIVVSGKGKAYKVKTDAKGGFKIKLPQGTYKVMESWRYYQQSPNAGVLQHFDKACLKLEWEKETMQISVTKDQVIVTPKNEIIFYCDWAYPCLLESHIPPMPE